MRKVALIISHKGSGSEELLSAMVKNPRIQQVTTSGLYHHPDVLESITSVPHKINNASAVYVDHLLYNHVFSSKSLYPFFKFIYVIREPRFFDSIYDFRYYVYRLRRICEMAKNTPGAVLLTWENLAAGRLGVIEDYLGLKESIVRPKVEACQISGEFINDAQRAYERFLYFLRNQNLRMP